MVAKGTSIDSFNIGVASELIAAAALMKTGWDVLLPFDRRGKYDLAGVKEGNFYRFQVKSAGWVSPKHTTSEYLRVQTRSKGIPYDPNYVDYLLFVCPEKRVWLVPTNIVGHFHIITLDKRVKSDKTWSTKQRFKSEDYLLTT